nr:MAG TPA: hypothetical protein [Caudoviricetes sp.]
MFRTGLFTNMCEIFFQAIRVKKKEKKPFAICLTKSGGKRLGKAQRTFQKQKKNSVKMRFLVKAAVKQKSPLLHTNVLANALTKTSTSGLEEAWVSEI